MKYKNFQIWKFWAHICESNYTLLALTRGLQLHASSVHVLLFAQLATGLPLALIGPWFAQLATS